MKVLFVFTILLIAVCLSQQAATNDCICFALYAPVCGVDGKTYSNSCWLQCAGVELAHKGRCEEKEKIVEKGEKEEIPNKDEKEQIVLLK